MEKLRFFKFALVGFFGTLIHLGVLYLLTEKLNLYYLLSSIIGFFIAVNWGFFINKLITFKENLKQNFVKKYFQFLIIAFFSGLINSFVVYSLTNYYGVFYLVSQLIASFVSLIINFTANSLWTFRR